MNTVQMKTLIEALNAIRSAEQFIKAPELSIVEGRSAVWTQLTMARIGLECELRFMQDVKVA
jgi:hypothetical protein